MKVNIDIRSNHKVRAFYLFFIISSLQIGAGIMGAPKYIFKEAQQDSWLSILIATIYIIIVVFAMIFILEQYESADIFGIQVDVFGQWIGKLLGIIYI
ncbi:MAG TPA: GerAB/ArcD/ProY family transporter, partial [Bacillota bacterium]|nr:GerAB/ArcD/ProY family transporter [Bacillota bacterium]